MTAWIYTPQSADGITFAADGQATVTVEQFELDLYSDIPFISPSLNTAPFWIPSPERGCVCYVIVLPACRGHS